MDQVPIPGPLAHDSDALLTVLCSPAYPVYGIHVIVYIARHCNLDFFGSFQFFFFFCSCSIQYDFILETKVTYMVTKYSS